MEKYILQVIRYFELFSYPPTMTELRMFLPKKISPTGLEKVIKRMEGEKQIFFQSNRIARKKSLFTVYKLKEARSKRYFKEAVAHLKVIKVLPFVKYIGISGSLSMLNMTSKGDIDVFVITTGNSIWTSRFFLLLYKYYLKLIYPDIGTKLCFNMFFSENGLKLPKKKENVYIGHELLQLKTVINNDFSYENLLLENRWLQKLFPNVLIKMSKKITYNERKSRIIENLLAAVQQRWLRMRGISWNSVNGQVWLIQEDFEKKIRI